MKILLVNPIMKPAEGLKIHNILSHNIDDSEYVIREWKAERCISFGLLAIATYLKKNGYTDITILDLEEENDFHYKHLQEVLDKDQYDLIGISCLTSKVLPSCYEIATVSKKLNKDSTVVVGGQNPQYMADKILEESPNIDLIIAGEGEQSMLQLVKSLKEKDFEKVGGAIFRTGKGIKRVPQNPYIDINEIRFLDYEMYPNWRSFMPVVEDSRGCPNRCMYCPNQDFYQGSIRIKDPDLLVDEIKRVYEMWDVKPLPITFMCSHFGASARATNKFLDGLEKADLDLRFISCTRVDSPWEKYYHRLKQFEVMHFGLESASPTILSRMNKTSKDINSYLVNAERSFAAFKKSKIHVGVNLVLGYIGETPDTLYETISFVFKNRANIDSLWGGGLISFPGAPFNKELEEAKAKFGTTLNTTPFFDLIQTYPVNASRHFSFNQITDIATVLMKMFNSRDSYYDHYRWFPKQTNSNRFELYTKKEFLNLFDTEKEGPGLIFNFSE